MTFVLSRGQKHQRREKQHQLMEASAELASSSVNALLTESDDEPAAANERSTEETAEAGETAEGKSSSAEVDGTDQRPLKSPFEEFAPPKTAPPKPPLQQTQPPRNVRFNGSLQSFSEEPEGEHPVIVGIISAARPGTEGLITSASPQFNRSKAQI